MKGRLVETEARQLSPRGLRTSQALRDAARTTFARMPYATARVEDIVAEAGVSHGTFYTYFENKAAILAALVEDVIGRMAAVAGGDWHGQDRRVALERVIRDVLQVYLEEGPVIAAWRDAVAEEPALRQRLAELREAFVARVAIDVELATGSDEHAAVVAPALVAMVEGYADGRLAGTSVEDRERAVRALAALWHGGLEALAD